MKSLAFVLGTALLSLSLWGQGAVPATAAVADPVVITVGSEKITRSMFEEIISTLPAQQQSQLQTPEARRSLAEQIAELKVMAQEAKARKLDQSTAVKARIGLQSDQILANAVYQELTAANPPTTFLYGQGSRVTPDGRTLYRLTFDGRKDGARYVVTGTPVHEKNDPRRAFEVLGETEVQSFNQTDPGIYVRLFNTGNGSASDAAFHVQVVELPGGAP